MPTDTLERELAGLDQLEVAVPPSTTRRFRWWATLWPKLVAVGVVLAIWQFLIWREWKPEYVFASPADVFQRLWDDMGTSEFWRAVGHTGRRAIVGFALSLIIGGAIGILVSRSYVLRLAIGSLITGLQTMPSIAWFPLAILVGGLTEKSIMFVVVLGAAPSIANGIISGIDGVPPSYHRLGANLGAGNVAMYRDIVVPAAMPAVIAGLKQGWAFSWRSLMAGELLVIIPGTQSIGTRLQFAREFSDAEGLMATMIVILVIGLIVDSIFGRAERSVLRRRGLTSSRGFGAFKL
jgi:NitT/TauT family transport system permease protein